MRYYGNVIDGGGDDSDQRMLRRVKSVSKEEQAVRDALAVVQADTGVERAQEIIRQQTYANWRAAEDAYNESTAVFPATTSAPSASVPVQNLIPQNQTPPPIVSPTPPTPTPTNTVASSVAKTITNPIKTATPDIILFDDSAVPVEIMTDLIFENIGGQELIGIARTDTINGQKIFYQPIKNINSINQEYNPNNIVGLQKTSDKIFSGFAIKLENKVPNVANSEDNNPVYIDASGNLIIDGVNINNDEQFEIEIALSGTIYETEI